MPDTTPDLSEFYALTHKKPCKVAGVLDLLKPKERAQLVAALEVDAGRIPHTVVLKWMDLNVKDLGAMRPTTEAVKRHREKECSCAK